MPKTYKNLSEFYPYYLLEHQNFVSRALHFIGTALFLTALVLALLLPKYWLLALCPVLGYGFAWVGHFFFEKNRPATFKYPFMSLISDFIMFYHIATLQIGNKMAAALKNKHIIE
jgi:hypothetical protein